MKKMSLSTKLARKIFSQIKNDSKKMHFSNLILKYKHYIKKTWEVIKESIRKGNVIIKVFQKTKLDRKNITDEDPIEKQFNTYFTQVGPKLA